MLCWSGRVFAKFGGKGGTQMAYVLVLACLWSAVGASVFFLPANITRPQRLGLTLATSVVFGAVGWVDVSSIVQAVRSGPAVVAKESVRPDIRLNQDGQLTAETTDLR
jgi:hypothetical protein